eukprot:10673765-Ditylum_brightwellii.AAC.1
MTGVNSGILSRDTGDSSIEHKTSNPGSEAARLATKALASSVTDVLTFPIFSEGTKITEETPMVEKAKIESEVGDKLPRGIQRKKFTAGSEVVRLGTQTLVGGIDGIISSISPYFEEEYANTGSTDTDKTEEGSNDGQTSTIQINTLVQQADIDQDTSAELLGARFAPKVTPKQLPGSEFARLAKNTLSDSVDELLHTVG